MKIIIYLATFVACLEPIYSLKSKRLYADFPFDKRSQMRRMLTQDGDDDGFKPGHTLLRPSEDWLRTSLGFPSTMVGGSAVYGASENIGRSRGDGTSVINVLFRRSGVDKHVKSLMNSLLSAVRRLSDEAGVNMDAEDEAGATHLRSDDGVSGASFPDPDTIAKPILRTDKAKDPEDKPPDSYDISTAMPTVQPQNEKNKGNPFTIFVKKYLQNALWNYKMDGDHMNLHVAAPAGGPPPLEPDGAQLFYGRKWWYFNQDDFLPF